MNKNDRIIATCNIIGILALFIDCSLSVLGENKLLLSFKILFATIAAVAYAIRLGIEIASDSDSHGIFPTFIITVCLLDIVLIILILM